jgi:hypothetical protein
MFNPQMMSQLQNQQFNSQQLALLNQINQINPLLLQSQLANINQHQQGQGAHQGQLNHAAKVTHQAAAGNAQQGNNSAASLSSMSPMSMMIPGAGQYLLIPQSLIQCQGQLGQNQLGQGQVGQGQFQQNQLQHQLNQQLFENRNQHFLDFEIFNQQQVATNIAQQQHKHQQQKRQNDFIKSSEMMTNIARSNASSPPTKDLQKIGKIHKLGANGSISGTPTSPNSLNTKNNSNQLNAARPLPKRVLVTRLPAHIKDQHVCHVYRFGACRT